MIPIYLRVSNNGRGFNRLGFFICLKPTLQTNSSTKTQTEADANSNAYGNDTRSEVPTKQSGSTPTTDNTSTKITLRDAVTEILRLPTEIQTQINADALNNAFVDFLGADASVKGQAYTRAAQSVVQAIDQISGMPGVSVEVKARLAALRQEIAESSSSINNVAEANIDYGLIKDYIIDIEKTTGIQLIHAQILELKKP